MNKFDIEVKLFYLKKFIRNNVISIFKEETNNQITNLFPNYIISTLHDSNFKKKKKIFYSKYY